jgi:hypothetical protein
MATGYRPKLAGTSRGNTWGQQYGSHGNEATTGQMRLGIDFPYVCERCLGSNPYIQMIKADFGASCKISKRPFHVFKWTNPETRRRMKTVICYEAASVRNCCQACMNDMTYGVPLVIRDALMKAAGQSIEQLPESEVGQSFFFNQRDKEQALVASGAVGIATAADPRLALEQAANQVFSSSSSSSSSSSNSRKRGRPGSSGNEAGYNTLWVAAQKGTTLPTESSIQGALLSFGPIQSVRRVEAKGFAFVEFEKAANAKAALESGVENIAGSAVIVKWADKQPNKKQHHHHHHHQNNGGGKGVGRGGGGGDRRVVKNRTIAAATQQQTWDGPALAAGFQVPHVPPTMRAFIAPNKTNVPLPIMFPVPTFEQAKKLYPSMKYSKRPKKESEKVD